MPISCHFRDCKAWLFLLLTDVSSTTASVQTFACSWFLVMWRGAWLFCQYCLCLLCNCLSHSLCLILHAAAWRLWCALWLFLLANFYFDQFQIQCLQKYHDTGYESVWQSLTALVWLCECSRLSQPGFWAHYNAAVIFTYSLPRVWSNFINVITCFLLYGGCFVFSKLKQLQTYNAYSFTREIKVFALLTSSVAHGRLAGSCRYVYSMW